MAYLLDTNIVSEAVLGALLVLPFEAPADTTYGVLRTDLERSGRPIGGNDLGSVLFLARIG